jgi:hypothetical protein
MTGPIFLLFLLFILIWFVLIYYRKDFFTFGPKGNFADPIFSPCQTSQDGIARQYAIQRCIPDSLSHRGCLLPDRTETWDPRIRTYICQPESTYEWKREEEICFPTNQEICRTPTTTGSRRVKLTCIKGDVDNFGTVIGCPYTDENLTTYYEVGRSILVDEICPPNLKPCGSYTLDNGAICHFGNTLSLIDECSTQNSLPLEEGYRLESLRCLFNDEPTICQDPPLGITPSLSALTDGSYLPSDYVKSGQNIECLGLCRKRPPPGLFRNYFGIFISAPQSYLSYSKTGQVVIAPYNDSFRENILYLIMSQVSISGSDYIVKIISGSKYLSHRRWLKYVGGLSLPDSLDQYVKGTSSLTTLASADTFLLTFHSDLKTGFVPDFQNGQQVGILSYYEASLKFNNGNPISINSVTLDNIALYLFPETYDFLISAF